MEPLLLVIPGCPNSGSAKELFDTALELEGIRAPATVREIRTEHEAHLHGFHGSPSFSVDGTDLFGSASEPAVSCRVYRTPDRFAGQPTLENLRGAIRASLRAPGPTA
ncbi:hypothetical protein DQ353_18740 [Arthrobacter sp. AQ5-05]|uniref:hypothetical protein n=1 Tax=Arthrobacter sp. AQ5-05 TaxID=2184581 RepID=UPI000DCF60AF|nr:hypothetical protein [Arthrobacter sp. AQ5-05]RAX47399.1 hypothetical protein DQ353_18740 [Arthrobacter sp. AQ5-05]